MTDRAGTSSPCEGEVGATRREGVKQRSRFSRTPEKTKKARRLRRQMTPAEWKLWKAIRCSSLRELGFRRQHPAGQYVLDFYCPALRLAVEVDGGHHNHEAERNKDENRNRWFALRGVTIRRFWNSEVNENLEGVIDENLRLAASLPTDALTPSLILPVSGGGDESGSHLDFVTADHAATQKRLKWSPSQRDGEGRD